MHYIGNFAYEALPSLSFATHSLALTSHTEWIARASATYGKQGGIDATAKAPLRKAASRLVYSQGTSIFGFSRAA